MSDPGLEEAIRAAGGITELARRIGISQPSVSDWSRIPAEREMAQAQASVNRLSAQRDELANKLDSMHGRSSNTALAAMLREARTTSPPTPTGGTLAAAPVRR